MSEASPDKVSANAKQLFFVGLGIIGALVGGYLWLLTGQLDTERIGAAKEVMLLLIGTQIGFLAGIADKLWGK